MDGTKVKSGCRWCSLDSDFTKASRLKVQVSIVCFSLMGWFLEKNLIPVSRLMNDVENT